MVPKSVLPCGLWRGQMRLKLYMVITGIVIINWSLKSLKGHRNAILVPGGAHPRGQAAGTTGGHFKTLGGPCWGWVSRPAGSGVYPAPSHCAGHMLHSLQCFVGVVCSAHRLCRGWPHACTSSEASAKPASNSRHPGWGVWHGQRHGLWEGSGCSRGSF